MWHVGSTWGAVDAISCPKRPGTETLVLPGGERWVGAPGPAGSRARGSRQRPCARRPSLPAPSTPGWDLFFPVILLLQL